MAILSLHWLLCFLTNPHVLACFPDGVQVDPSRAAKFPNLVSPVRLKSLVVRRRAIGYPAYAVRRSLPQGGKVSSDSSNLLMVYKGELKQDIRHAGCEDHIRGSRQCSMPLHCGRPGRQVLHLGEE